MIRTLLALCGGVATLDAAAAQSLEEIMQQALDGSQSLAAERATLDAQREAAHQARSSALPSLSVSGFAGAREVDYNAGGDGDAFLRSLGFSNFDATGLDPARTSTGVGLSSKQTLFAGGRIRNSIRAAKASVRAAEAGFSAGVEDTIFEIISSYYDVVRADAQSRALEQSAKTLREQERALSKSFDIGRATRTDLASVAAQRADVEARHATARAQAGSARHNFEALTGLVGGEFVMSPDTPTYPDTVDQVISIAKASNGNLRAAEAVVEASDAQVRAAKGQHLPAFELAGALSYAEGNLIQGDSIETASVQLQVAFPIFSGGRIRSEVRQAKAELRSNKFSQADLNRRLEAAIRGAHGEAVAASMSRSSADAQVEAQAIAYKGVSIEAGLGQRTTLDVLDAEDDLLRARFSAIDARIRERLTIYNLLRLSGGLSRTFGVSDLTEY